MVDSLPHSQSPIIGSMKHLDLIVADASHLGILLPLVRAYHEFEHLVLTDEQRRAGLSPLLAENSPLGRIWMIRYRGEFVGYIAICFGYSIEFCGRDAFVDEFFLKEEARGHGIGTVTLDLVKQQAESMGIAALHLEVARTNLKAKNLYARLGFRLREGYFLMSCIVSQRDGRDSQA